MELALILLILIVAAVLASLKGSDSRPSLDDEPHRAI